MYLGQLADAVQGQPALKTISLQKAIQFLRFASLACGQIQLMQHDVACPPAQLPGNVRFLLKKLLHEDEATVSLLWSLLKAEVWAASETPVVATEAEIEAFNEAALGLKTCE